MCREVKAEVFHPISTERARVLTRLADLITVKRLAHPLRIGIDGRTACGKTTFATELADALRRRDRTVILTSIDGFHRPREERYARGRLSPEGYYYDARDHEAIRRLLLEPLGFAGDLRYRTASFDLERDEPVRQKPLTAPSDAIVIIDGTFLQRAELRDGFDAVVFLSTSAEVAERRGIARDVSVEETDVAFVRRLYALRYEAAYAIYMERCHPSAGADAVVNNDDLERPFLNVRRTGRLYDAHQAPRKSRTARG